MKSSEPASRPPARPWWMTAMAGFCLLTVAFLVPRDLFHDDASETEVWLGFELEGTAARLTAPIHWAIFLLGAWGFWNSRPWIAPSAAAYSFYIALSHLLWSGMSATGYGWLPGLGLALFFALPGAALIYLHRSTNRTRFTRGQPRRTRAPQGDP